MPARTTIRYTVDTYISKSFPTTVRLQRFTHHSPTLRTFSQPIHSFLNPNFYPYLPSKPYTTSPIMGKKKIQNEYNDFLDGEKLRDNADVRTTLQGTSSTRQDISPPPTRRDKKGKGKGKKGGPKKPQLTHFLCLPLVNDGSRPQLESTLKMFGEEVEKMGLVSTRAIRPVGTLHLTLGVMSLDEAGVEAAGKALEELDLKSMLQREGNVQRQEESTGDSVSPQSQNSSQKTDQPSTTSKQTDFKPPSIDLKSLVPMQQPHKTSILYAEPTDSSSRLYPFASALRVHFTEKGHLIEDKRSLRLHATIINTIYAKPRGRHSGNKNTKHSKKLATAEQAETPKAPEEDDNVSTVDSDNEGQTAPPDASTAETEIMPPSEIIDRSEGHGPNAKSWMRFNASGLIEQYKDYVWAEGVTVDRVQICKMGAKKILGEDGGVLDERYEVVHEKWI